VVLRQVVVVLALAWRGPSVGFLAKGGVALTLRSPIAPESLHPDAGGSVYTISAFDCLDSTFDVATMLNAPRTRSTVFADSTFS
jgi:hypothetical protein